MNESRRSLHADGGAHVAYARRWRRRAQWGPHDPERGGAAGGNRGAQERGRGERLQVFNADDYEDFTRIVAFFSNEV